MKNLRLSEVSGLGRSAQMGLEPPKRMENFENGHLASPGPWDVHIYLVFGCFVSEQRVTGLELIFQVISSIFGFHGFSPLSPLISHISVTLVSLRS